MCGRVLLQYGDSEQVVIWVNKIGPFNNPQETYTYNSLPFCKALGMEEPEAHALGIGEILEGNELFNSGHRVEFAVDTGRTTLCEQTLSDSDALKFAAAVSTVVDWFVVLWWWLCTELALCVCVCAYRWTSTTGTS